MKPIYEIVYPTLRLDLLYSSLCWRKIKVSFLEPVESPQWLTNYKLQHWHCVKFSMSVGDLPKGPRLDTTLHILSCYMSCVLFVINQPGSCLSGTPEVITFVVMFRFCFGSASNETLHMHHTHIVIFRVAPHGVI